MNSAMHDDTASVFTTRDWKKALEVLRALLLGTFLTDLRYSAGFSVEFARESEPPSSLIPMVVRLTLRSNWRIGTAEEWEALLSRLPIKPEGGEPGDPARAYMLMIIGGREVTAVRVTGGSLTIEVAGDEILVVPGTENEFEESWIVDVPPDVPNAALWSVVCTDRGEVYCRYPSAWS
jgi:hypothetical protein